MLKKLTNYKIVLLLCTAIVIAIIIASHKSKVAEPVSPALTVAAAANLSAAFQEIGQNYYKATGNKVEFNFGSTGILVQQVENGAPFDILAAANVSYIDNLAEKAKIIAGSKKLYAKGRIGIAVLKNNPLKITNLQDLLTPAVKKIAIANPLHTPYGLAAKQALEHSGIWSKLQDKLVYGNNIQETLSLLLTGNADTAIIALSISKNPGISFILIDEQLHAPLIQALAIIKGTAKEALARQFIDYLASPESRNIMQKYGFVLPEQ